jgi:hypothetical protein
VYPALKFRSHDTLRTGEAHAALLPSKWFGVCIAEIF